MKDLNTNQAIRDLRALVDHARETYPHFESPRGVSDILHAEQAITTIEEFLAQQEALEQFVHCSKCGEDMARMASGSTGDVGSWADYECPTCHAKIVITLEPFD